MRAFPTLLTPEYGRNYLNRIRPTFLKRSDPFLVVNFWRIIYVCRANGIFNVTEVREIGTFVISSRAATYGADETWAGKILGNSKKRGSRERERNAEGRVSGARGITRSEETWNGDERAE